MKELFLIELEDVEHRPWFETKFAERIESVPCREVERPDDDTIVIKSVIKSEKFVRERTCRRVVKGKRYGFDKQVCSECGYGIGDARWLFCPKCGARIEEKA